jgi:hypothetical protein
VDFRRHFAQDFSNHMRRPAAMSNPLTIMVAEPIAGAREALKELKHAGHTIVIYTARGWAEYRYTKSWLDEHGMSYDAIQMGKPIGHVWIDDRAIAFREWQQTLRELRADYGV